MYKATLWVTLLGTALAACGDDDGGNQNENQNNVQAICGDGIVQAGEVCDDGPDNSDLTPDACRSDCRPAACGDKVVDTDEECDDGEANSDRLANACRTDCRAPRCGDGVTDADETCDDGNDTAGDGCDATCQVEDHWNCTGQPSTCDCAPYHLGNACAKCIVYVDVGPVSGTRNGTTWDTAYATVQQGVDRAAAEGPGCQVWVARGRYLIYRASALDSVHLRDGVTVLGGFPPGATDASERDPAEQVTILDGRSEADPDHRVFHVVTAKGTVDATLGGVMITGGEADGRDVNQDDVGGGLYAYATNLILRNVVFLQNTSDVQGGAVYAFASDGLRLEACDFLENVSAQGGAIFLEETSADIERCTFVRNRAFQSNMSGTNYGGAVYITQGEPRIYRNVFLANEAVADLYHPNSIGGAIYSAGYTNISRSLFVGDVAIEGSAIYEIGGNARIRNVTITGQSCDTSALRFGNGGMYLNDQYVYNSILWDNSCPAMDYPQAPFFVDLDPPIPSGYASLAAPQIVTALDPMFVGGFGSPARSSTWTDVIYDPDTNRTRLVDDTATWTPGDLDGQVLQPDTVYTGRYYPARADTATSITAWGDLSLWVQVGDAYRIYDFRLAAGSPMIDAGWGDESVFPSFLGLPIQDDPASPNDGYGTPTTVDLGAYEYQP